MAVWYLGRTFADVTFVDGLLQTDFCGRDFWGRDFYGRDFCGRTFADGFLQTDFCGREVCGWTAPPPPNIFSEVTLVPPPAFLAWRLFFVSHFEQKMTKKWQFEQKIIKIGNLGDLFSDLPPRKFWILCLYLGLPDFNITTLQSGNPINIQRFS